MSVRREVPSTRGPTLVLENHAHGIDSQERRGGFPWSLSMDSCGKLKFFREGKRTSTAEQLNRTMQMKSSTQGSSDNRPRDYLPARREKPEHGSLMGGAAPSGTARRAPARSLAHSGLARCSRIGWRAAQASAERGGVWILRKAWGSAPGKRSR
jgi:hypothetical protein